MNNEGGKSFYELLLNLDKTSVDKVMKEFDRIGNHAEAEGKRIDNVFKKVGAGLAGYFAVDTLMNFGKEIIKVRSDIESFEVSFSTLLGSEKKAKAFFGELKQFAVETPMGLKDLAGGAQTMLGFNIAAEKVIPTLRQIGDISMGNSQKFNSLVLAFSQMYSTGKLMGQDLLQMINAGFNPLAVISEKTGKNIGVLKEEMSEGRISAEMVADAFATATAEGGKFHNMLLKQSKGMEGARTNFEGAVEDVANAIGQKLQPAVVEAYYIGTELAKNYETVGSILLYLISTYGLYKAALIAVNTIERVNIAILRQAVVEKRLAAAANIALSNSAAIAAAKAKLFAIAQKGVVASLKGVGKALTNPYLLAAAALTTAGFALYEFISRETEAERVQRLYNESKNRAVELEVEHKEKVNDLIDKIGDETAAEMERVGAMETLKKLYPGIIEKYIDEEGHLKELIALKNELAGIDAQRRQEGNRTELSELDRQIREREAYLLNMRTNDQSAFDDEVRVLEELKRQREIARQNVASDYLNNAIAKAKAKSDAELAKEIEAYQNALSENTGEWFGSGKDFKTDEIRTYISALIDLQNARAGVVKNKDYWKKQKEDAENALAAMADTEKGSIAWNAVVAKIREAESHLSKYDISVTKRQKEVSGDLLELRRKNQQDEINLMKEGTEKKRAQIELDYQREYDAYLEAKKKYGETPEVSAMLSNAQQKRSNSIAALDKEYEGMLKEYQSYTDKRLAIEKKFNDDIKILRDALSKAQTSGNTDEVERIKRSIATATAEKGRELMAHDFEVLKKSPDYIRAFEDLRNTSTETLNSLLSQLEEAKSVAAETLNPEDLREYTTTIQQIMDELDSRNPFQALADAQKELAEAEKELAEAESRLDKVQRGQKVVKTHRLDKETGKIITIYWEAAEAVEEYNKAKDKHTKANNKFIKAEKEAYEVVEKLADSLKEIGNTIGGTAGMCLSLIGDIASFASMCMVGTSQVAETSSKAIQAVEKASVILGIISAAISILQKISELGNNKAFKQYEAYAEKVKEINKLTDAVNEYRIAVLQARQEESGWFAENNLQNLRDYKQIQQEVLKAYGDKLMESQAVYQNESGGGWLTGAVNWIMGSLSPLGWVSEAWRNIWGQGNYDKGQTAAINNLRIETRKKSSGFLGTGIGGKSQKTENLIDWARNQGLGELFDERGFIDKELAEIILEKYGDKLVGQTKETLEALIELREQYDEYISQLREYVSSLYEPLVDNFVDSIWDWFDEGKDALDSFKSYATDTFRDIVSDMMRTIVLEKVVGSFSDDIAALYEEYAMGAINEAQLMKKVAERTGILVDNYESNIPTLQNIMNQVNEYLESAGISLKHSEDEEESERTASTGVGAKFDQDSIDELRGAATALHINSEVNKTNLITIQADVQAIKSAINADAKNTEEIRNLSRTAVEHLAEISRNTYELYETNRRLENMEKGIDNINTRGVTIRK